MIELYGYSSLKEEDYSRSVEACSKYATGLSSEVFFEIMSNKIILCFDDKFGSLDYDPHDLLSRFVDDILSIDVIELKDRIENHSLKDSEIPMFNSISSINPLLHRMSEEKYLTYLTAGDILCSFYSNRTAKTKAGELHLKLLSMLGLGELALTTPRKCNITLLGRYYLSLNAQDREILLQKLIIKIPIISVLLKEASVNPVSIRKTIEDGQISGTTIGRRASSVKALIDVLDRGNDAKIHKLCSNIYM